MVIKSSFPVDSEGMYRFSRRVSPCDLNDQGYLFGGTALKWMDEAAYGAASSLTNHRMVTRWVHDLHFRNPVKPGTLVEVTAVPSGFGLASVDMRVKVCVQEQTNGISCGAIEGIFQFVSVDGDGKPVKFSSSEKRRLEGILSKNQNV